MNRALWLLPLAAALAAGCTRDTGVADEVRGALAEASSEVSREVREARTKIAEEMATQNITLRGGDGLPKAELTPDGELLISGVAVVMTPEQRQAATAYRAELARVVTGAAAIGLDSASLATDAMGLAASQLFGGDGKATEASIESHADRIEASARALCDSLPALESAQAAFIAAVPEFAPYADDIDVDIKGCDTKA